jgi:hypothetical protein
MRQKRKQASKQIAAAPIHRAIPLQETPPPPQQQPGDAGQVALAAAALHQLNRYAQDVQNYLNSSKLRLLVNQIEADIRLNPPPAPRMRLRRD